MSICLRFKSCIFMQDTVCIIQTVFVLNPER